jgi:hypothetical protein
MAVMSLTLYWTQLDESIRMNVSIEYTHGARGIAVNQSSPGKVIPASMKLIRNMKCLRGNLPDGDPLGSRCRNKAVRRSSYREATVCFVVTRSQRQ